VVGFSFEKSGCARGTLGRVLTCFEGGAGILQEVV